MALLCRDARAVASGAGQWCAPLSSKNGRIADSRKEMRQKAQKRDKKSPGEQGYARALLPPAAIYTATGALMAG